MLFGRIICADVYNQITMTWPHDCSTNIFSHYRIAFLQVMSQEILSRLKFWVCPDFSFVHSFRFPLFFIFHFHLSGTGWACWKCWNLFFKPNENFSKHVDGQWPIICFQISTKICLFYRKSGLYKCRSYFLNVYREFDGFFCLSFVSDRPIKATRRWRFN